MTETLERTHVRPARLLIIHVICNDILTLQPSQPEPLNNMSKLIYVLCLGVYHDKCCKIKYFEGLLLQWLLAYYCSQPPSTLGLSNIGLGSTWMGDRCMMSISADSPSDKTLTRYPRSLGAALAATV